MKRITIKHRTADGFSHQTFELDDEDVVLDSYKADAEGRKIMLPVHIREQLSRPRPQGADAPTVSDKPSVSSPGLFAQKIFDPGTEIDEEGLDLRSQIQRRIEQAIGQADPRVIRMAYEACISGYISLVRFGMKRKNSPTQITSKSQAAFEARREIGRRFLSPDEDCFFPDCEELRRERQAELELAGGDDCPGCKRTSINDKYINLAVNKYNASVR